MSRLGAAFDAFALILLPVLASVGAVTFLRLVQSSIEDIAYAHRIALLRSFYLRVTPELEPYLVVGSAASPAAAASPGTWHPSLLGRATRPPASSESSIPAGLPGRCRAGRRGRAGSAPRPDLRGRAAERGAA
jgi:hypothetical protein